MTADLYERLADRLDALPNGFPRTSSGVELQLLGKIFTQEQAQIAVTLGREFETPEAIAARVGRPVQDVTATLKDMARNDLVWARRGESGLEFRLAPFVVGIYEGQLWRMDREFAELFERYLAEGAMRSIMAAQPALQRVVPAQKATNVEWILPYDDVKVLLQRARGFSLRDCICRYERSLIGKACDAPLRMCLAFTEYDRPPHSNTISKDEALAVLDRAEEVGLVHSVMNTVESVTYVCNCCGCCCGILRGITEFGLANSVARANYYAEIDQDACGTCGICMERCQVKAITTDGKSYWVDRSRCIGCGLCVTGCPDQAAHLHPLPASEMIHPPVTFRDWEEARLAGRGHRH